MGLHGVTMKALQSIITSSGGASRFASSIAYSHAYVHRVLNGGTPSFAFCQAVRARYGVILDPAEWPDARRKSRDGEVDETCDTADEAVTR